MGTTANYSWPTPVATDLVKDGWEAIKDLGDAADTTVKAVSDAQGLVHINETTFSGVTSVSLPNNTFTTTYDSYLLVLNYTVSTSAETRFRTRLAGTDATGSNYDHYANAFTNAFNNQASLSGQTSNYIGGLDVNHNSLMQIYNIALAANTTFVTTGVGSGRTGLYASGIHNVATAYDSATFFRSSGTMTGSIITLGVKK